MSGYRAGETQKEAKLRRNQITKMPWWTREELKDEQVQPWGKPKGLKREDFQFYDAKSFIRTMILSGI